ncbi:tyrosine-type recombinase/integrase [Bradyrhizobium iriomotense]|uniref:tyrosine-type recombinase/integrase n=1 Tax=Bradyrhizobium iriomotense TaxID=441950 RepID=UPI001B8A192B|nr:site-specific integrase [Bradyrhizobium iriomotense]MBR0783937.1 tyrosine-type recombinase/integrase [Bradyrhizobium iriomotense]
MSRRSSDLRRRLPAGCVEDIDRHGNVRIYYRAKGARKVRLRGTPWAPEFMAAYEEAKSGTSASRAVIGVGTWRWLCVKYFAECADYKRLDPRTRHVRRLVLESTFDEPIAPGSLKYFRDMPLSKMTSNAVEVMRDRKLDHPEAANARVKAIRQVFKFAVRRKQAAFNPARDVPYIRTGSTGYHTWSVEEVRQFEEHHPIGSKARLALALLAFTGQRRSDIVRLGKQHMKAGKLSFTQHKNRNRKPKKLILPVLPALQAVIDKSPCGDLTFLVTQFGKPFTEAGFGNKFREWCDEAGLHHCTAHGLRKAGATIAANNGATSRQLMAIFGWDSIRMAEEYTRRADQQRLAEDAMHLIEPRDAKA